MFNWRRPLKNYTLMTSLLLLAVHPSLNFAHNFIFVRQKVSVALIECFIIVKGVLRRPTLIKRVGREWWTTWPDGFLASNSFLVYVMCVSEFNPTHPFQCKLVLSLILRPQFLYNCPVYRNRVILIKRSRAGMMSFLRAIVDKLNPHFSNTGVSSRLKLNLTLFTPYQ